jgi:hypothetical protein
MSKQSERYLEGQHSPGGRGYSNMTREMDWVGVEAEEMGSIKMVLATSPIEGVSALSTGRTF